MSTRTLRVDFYRDADKKWRWNAHRQFTPPRILSDSGEGYSRRIDAVAAMCTDKGINPDEITWISEDRVRKYGQATRRHDVVEVFIWKLQVKA